MANCKLEECTKEDLLYIIDQMRQYPSYEDHLNRSLAKLEGKRANDLVLAIEKCDNLAREKRIAFDEMVKQYEGVKDEDIPHDIHKKMGKLASELLALYRKQDKLMKRMHS